jgi:hypothetical protein
MFCLFAKHDVQSNKIEHNGNIKENTYNSIYIDIYNKKIQDVPTVPCFNCERLCFLKQLKCFSNNCQDNFLYFFKFKYNIVQHHTYVYIFTQY